MSDLSERLRERTDDYEKMIDEAADEIDRLREALERIAHIRNEVFVRNPQTLREAKDMARAALAKEAGQ